MYFHKKMIGLPLARLRRKIKLFVNANKSGKWYITRGTNRLEAFWPRVNALIRSNRTTIGLKYCEDLLYVHFVNVNLKKEVEFNPNMKYNFINAAMFEMYVNIHGKLHK